MSTHFEQELEALKNKLLTMAGYAEQAVSRAIQALVRRDDQLACEVEEEDKILDQLEIDVDDLSITLLAKAPLAMHLRFITVAMKASHDLERVGDEATNIARRVQKLNAEPAPSLEVDLPHMAALALHLLKDALESYVKRDPAKALSVIPRDKQVDALNKQCYQTVVNAMVKDPALITRGLHLMAIAKSLERIADHATNIAEEVVFLYQGRDVRHLTELKTPGPARS